MFDDLLEANCNYQRTFPHGELAAAARKGLAVVTCIDSRIEPLAMLGLVPGDAKIMRNAGGRVTDDALRSLVLAVNLLGVDRVAVVQHTDCAMSSTTDDELRDRLADRYGAVAREWSFATIDAPLPTLTADVERVRACPLLPDDLEVAGFVYDVRTGVLELAVE